MPTDASSTSSGLAWAVEWRLIGSTPVSGTDLDPISPAAAAEWYLKHRRETHRIATRRKYRTALDFFVDWTETVGLQNMNDLAGRHLMEFKTWRKHNYAIETLSLNGNLGILQRFLSFCEDIEAVAEGVAAKVPLPTVPPEAEVNYRVPDDEEVERIRTYFSQFEYATRKHAQYELVAEVGVRLGAVRAIDMVDFDPERSVVHVRDRPEGTDEYGTPLKNGAHGERIINLSPELGTIIEDYVEYHRLGVRDKYGRAPLFTTKYGRPSRATIRRDFYKLSRPCEVGGGCPHGREIQACDAVSNANASTCPSSFSTHPLRKWSIMHQLDAGVPKELLSDRVDVSVPVLEKHYDHRTEQRKSRQRKNILEKKLYQEENRNGIWGIEHNR